MRKIIAIMASSLFVLTTTTACDWNDAAEKAKNATITVVEAIGNHAINTFKTASSKECAEAALHSFGVGGDAIQAWKNNDYKKLPKNEQKNLADGLKVAAKNCLTFVN